MTSHRPRPTHGAKKHGLGGPCYDDLVADIADGNNTPQYELTGDNQDDQDDLVRWLALAGASNLVSGNSYLFGDANLDGTVDGEDFQRWNANKFSGGALWSGGDFNADGVTDGQDFLIWNGNKFMSADGASHVNTPQADSDLDRDGRELKPSTLIDLLFASML